MIRVGVLGSSGKMGRTVCEAVDADPELELVARVDPNGGDALEAITKADVAVDFTRPDQVMDDIRFCLAGGVHCVIGTTGITEADLEEISGLTSTHGRNVFIAPNFCLGVVLAIQFAQRAARFFGSCEVIEQHHNQKLDAPSGTAIRTAEQIAGVWAEHGRPPGGEPAAGETETVAGARGASIGGVGVHAVRLLGLEAHQEIIFGGLGQALTLRHDTYSRTAYMPGVLTAVKRIAGIPGVTVGLERLLDLD